VLVVWERETVLMFSEATAVGRVGVGCIGGRNTPPLGTNVHIRLFLALRKDLEGKVDCD
jgi:hypothetical protein